MKLTPDQVLSISKGDQEIALFITALLTRIDELELQVNDLKRQLGQNSNNSSKPPSSDGFRKPTNLRTPGGKKGAPKGHKGNTLLFSESPDEIVIYPVSSCTQCHTSLEGVASSNYVKRQVFDLPLPRMIITEHRAEEKCCPHCQTRQLAVFPDEVNAPVQYGKGCSAWTAYLNVYQLIPLDRISQLFKDLTGFRLSEGTLLTQLKKMSSALTPILATIRAHISQADIIHCDETGLRLDGKQHYVHTASTKDWTYLEVQESRGSKGMDAIGILPFYKGMVVHDCYITYFRSEYQFTHVLCNAHLLRECQGIMENDHHEWAKDMKELLQRSWVLTKEVRAKHLPLCDEVLNAIELRYDDILQSGKAEWAKDKKPEKTGPRGRKAKSTAENLGERFQLYSKAILRFLYDARVPFDNNQGERDLRMSKVKEKISGAFRTVLGGQQFVAIRGFISTLLKQNLPIYSSLTSVLKGHFSF